jgi:hypothetical protein
MRVEFNNTLAHCHELCHPLLNGLKAGVESNNTLAHYHELCHPLLNGLKAGVESNNIPRTLTMNSVTRC